MSSAYCGPGSPGPVGGFAMTAQVGRKMCQRRLSAGITGEIPASAGESVQ